MSLVRFESQTVVRRPVSEVFERLADLPGYRRWMHRDGVFGATEVTSPPPIRAGTAYIDRTRMGRFVGEVTEYVPARTGGGDVSSVPPNTPSRCIHRP